MDPNSVIEYRGFSRFHMKIGSRSRERDVVMCTQALACGRRVSKRKTDIRETIESVWKMANAEFIRAAASSHLAQVQTLSTAMV